MFISVSRSEHLCHQWLKFHKRDRPQNTLKAGGTRLSRPFFLPLNTQNGFADTEHAESIGNVGPRLPAIFQVSQETCSVTDAAGPLLIKCGPAGVIGDGVAA